MMVTVKMYEVFDDNDDDNGDIDDILKLYKKVIKSIPRVNSYRNTIREHQTWPGNWHSG